MSSPPSGITVAGDRRPNQTSTASQTDTASWYLKPRPASDPDLLAGRAPMADVRASIRRRLRPFRPLLASRPPRSTSRVRFAMNQLPSRRVGEIPSRDSRSMRLQKSSLTTTNECGIYTYSQCQDRWSAAEPFRPCRVPRDAGQLRGPRKSTTKSNVVKTARYHSANSRKSPGVNSIHTHRTVT